MKNLFFLLAISAFLFVNNTGCNSGDTNAADSTKVDSSKITVADFLTAAEKWVGKDVTISGTVSHVCRHSGKKLFVFGADPEQTVKINAGGEVSAFDVNLEGTDVEVTGTVVEDSRIDETYLNEWEAEIKQSVEDKDQKVCNAENQAISTQKGDSTVTQAVEDPYADVKEFRKKLAESGKTYIPIFAIDCKTLKQIKK